MTTRRRTTRRPRGARRPLARRAHRARRAGFTLVELLVALVLLTVGLLAMAGVAVTASKQIRAGGTQTVAAAIAQSRFDVFAAQACSNLANNPVVVGTATTRRIVEKWVITDGNDVVFIADTVRIPGRTRPLVYLSVLPCRD